MSGIRCNEENSWDRFEKVCKAFRAEYPTVGGSFALSQDGALVNYVTYSMTSDNTDDGHVYVLEVRYQLVATPEELVERNVDVTRLNLPVLPEDEYTAEGETVTVQWRTIGNPVAYAAGGEQSLDNILSELQKS